MSPRPILKRPHSTPEQHPHHSHQHHIPHPFHNHHHNAVHFPPSPALTRTFSAYSASAYDRSPIVVAPNSCALPERGCPGRTYTLEEGAAPLSPRGIAFARDYLPCALAFASSSNACGPAYTPVVPALVPDLSSESDESDGVSSLPAALASPAYHPGAYAPPKAVGFAQEQAYLPYADEREHRHRGAAYPPSSSPPGSAFAPNQEDASQAPPQPHRRRERRHESSCDPDRIPDGEAGAAPPSSSPPPPRRKGVRRHHAPALPPTLAAGFGVPDDGCLGGF